MGKRLGSRSPSKGLLHAQRASKIRLNCGLARGAVVAYCVVYRLIRDYVTRLSPWQLARPPPQGPSAPTAYAGTGLLIKHLFF